MCSRPFPLAECYQVIVKCQEHLDLEGDHVIQFSSPGQLKVWGMDGQLQWEWLLQDVRRVYYHQSSDQLEIEVGRYVNVVDGMSMWCMCEKNGVLQHNY